MKKFKAEKVRDGKVWGRSWYDEESVIVCDVCGGEYPFNRRYERAAIKGDLHIKYCKGGKDVPEDCE